MTGLTALSLTLARRLGEEILAGFIIPAILVLISVTVLVLVVIPVNLLMGFSSVGYTQLGIALTLAKMGKNVLGKCVSLHILLVSSGSYLSALGLHVLLACVLALAI